MASTNTPSAAGSSRPNTWTAELNLRYRCNNRDGSDATVATHSHSGPIRILKSLYPEGPAVCHNVMIHPPGGLVGGDEVVINLDVQDNAHALISTPGATRYYLSDEVLAAQRIRIQLGEHARLEWLPLETIAYSGCRGENQWQATLAPSAQVIGWDVIGLGLPHASQPFETGSFVQQLVISNIWREAAYLHANDKLLMDGQLGLNGYRTMGTMWWAQGSALTASQRERCLQACRDALSAWSSDTPCAITSPNDNMVVVRALAPTVEPIMHRFQSLWPVFRRIAWNMDAPMPRIWGV